ncbi:MAG: hypothetical protein A3C58_00775 [Candidatus Staskawiczbacteria bacterium RIFCSPHIGHO2_02_FULL_34_10]|uniref:Uncharacterized protein n=2 Tax=Candidatus Staskawicziibacteriota TaxID=1817916 RepID=A0A1G2HL61_9BACT|nr:MAG: hypothetical protein A2639_01575 [Candidatus Staskawiczbacteria bacterium RIFCSPHIGHO2_01_FULL_34_27]OGZ66963.1 MAG: hypothetical protein A3C58_00775 [Candidatus Staskawiczbacteria bacterium RIFCSPHIGHO2_02_FULL_34_10]
MEDKQTTKILRGCLGGCERKVDRAKGIFFCSQCAFKKDHAKIPHTLIQVRKTTKGSGKRIQYDS